VIDSKRASMAAVLSDRFDEQPVAVLVVAN
jgi:hypothetical protein